ncbi:hypothetical protein V8C35DRAFT_189218 [Trichoderma chlorosporum]
MQKAPYLASHDIQSPPIYPERSKVAKYSTIPNTPSPPQRATGQKTRWGETREAEKNLSAGGEGREDFPRMIVHTDHKPQRHSGSSRPSEAPNLASHAPSVDYHPTNHLPGFLTSYMELFAGVHEPILELPAQAMAHSSLVTGQVGNQTLLAAVSTRAAARHPRVHVKYLSKPAYQKNPYRCSSKNLPRHRPLISTSKHRRDSASPQQQHPSPSCRSHHDQRVESIDDPSLEPVLVHVSATNTPLRHTGLVSGGRRDHLSSP